MTQLIESITTAHENCDGCTIARARLTHSTGHKATIHASVNGWTGEHYAYRDGLECWHCGERMTEEEAEHHDCDPTPYAQSTVITCETCAPLAGNGFMVKTVIEYRGAYTFTCESCGHRKDGPITLNHLAL